MDEGLSSISLFVKEALARKEGKAALAKASVDKQNREDKGCVHLAGEYYVAAELHRRGTHATITYGNAKSADILAFSLEGDRFARVEVKASRSSKGKVLAWNGTLERFVLKPNQFWVLCVLPEAYDEDSAPSYFVFSAAEMHSAINEKYQAYAAHRAGEGDQKGWKWSFTLSELDTSGARGAWAKIIDYLSK